MTEQNFEQMRRAMVTGQLRTTAVNDPRVVAAMSVVPRERYVPAAQQPLAYVDTALPLGGGRWLPAPMVIGRLLTEARLRGGERALVIGAGSGYSAAVLAELVASVVALEEDATLGGSGPAAARVEQVAGPLASGWAETAPYDLILFDGAVERIPDAIIDQLAEGGRIAAPLVRGGVVRLAIGRREGAGFAMVPFADSEARPLPGFEIERGFRF